MERASFSSVETIGRDKAASFVSLSRGGLFYCRARIKYNPPALFWLRRTLRGCVGRPRLFMYVSERLRVG